MAKADLYRDFEVHRGASKSRFVLPDHCGVPVFAPSLCALGVSFLEDELAART
jgi:hypothetical protein